MFIQSLSLICCIFAVVSFAVLFMTMTQDSFFCFPLYLPHNYCSQSRLMLQWRRKNTRTSSINLSLNLVECAMAQVRRRESEQPRITLLHSMIYLDLCTFISLATESRGL